MCFGQLEARIRSSRSTSNKHCRFPASAAQFLYSQSPPLPRRGALRAFKRGNRKSCYRSASLGFRPASNSLQWTGENREHPWGIMLTAISRLRLALEWTGTIWVAATGNRNSIYENSNFVVAGRQQGNRRCGFQLSSKAAYQRSENRFRRAGYRFPCHCRVLSLHACPEQATHDA
jgi:hypothetical protein